MKDPVIHLGAVVRDSMGREGIVLSKEPEPPPDWLEDQANAEDIKALGPRIQWWGVMPFDGGYLLLPGPMLTRLRDASFDDFLRAVDHAGTEGRLSLAKVFPHYVDRVLELRPGKADN
jgi:hypothetical protein